MRLYESSLWISDLDEILAAFPEIDQLAGRSVLITGCTGLICSAAADLLIRWNDRHEDKIRILAAGRDERRVRSRFAPYDAEDWFTYVPFDAASTEDLPDLPCDYIIHGASNASPDRIVAEPVETLLGNVTGMKVLLDYARRKDAKRVLFVSSSEVYGKKESDMPSKIDEYGYIDLLKSRNSYAIGKCAAETLCVSYAEEYGVESVIVRPGHIYGPTASASDKRVSSAWAYATALGGDIVMKSDGAQIRSYCYCLDCASAILKVLLCGENAHAYNISNPDSIITIRDLASILTEAAGVTLRMELPTEQEKKAFNPMKNSSLDAETLLELGWRGLFDAGRGLSHTVTIIREINKCR